MERVKASRSYFFGPDYFERMTVDLGGAITLVLVEQGNDLVSGGLFSEMMGNVNYLYGGTGNSFAQSGASRLMLHFARRWARERGNKVLLLGGGVQGKEDGLYWFKTGFSKDRATYTTWRVIADPSKFQEATQRWARVSKPLQVTEQSLDYFPPYRRQPGQ